jgi:hypothetical protein
MEVDCIKCINDKVKKIDSEIAFEAETLEENYNKGQFLYDVQTKLFSKCIRLLQLCIYLQAKELKCLAYDSNKDRDSSNFRHIYIYKK